MYQESRDNEMRPREAYLIIPHGLVEPTQVTVMFGRLDVILPERALSKRQRGQVKLLRFVK